MKNFKYFFFLLVLIPHTGFSQDSLLLDSLENKLRQYEAHKLEIQGKTPELNDTVKVNLLFELSKAYWYSDFEKGLEYANQSLHLAEQVGFKKGAVDSYYSMGVINYIKGNYAQGMEQSKMSLTIAQEINDKHGIVDAYINLGNIVIALGNAPEGLKYYFSSLKIAQEIGYKKGIVYNYDNIAVSYLNQDNYTEALKYLFASIKIKKGNGDPMYLAVDYENIAVCYAYQGNYAAALKYYSEALQLNLASGNKIWESHNYGGIGVVYGMQGMYNEALKNYFLALKMAKEADNKGGMTMWLNNIGVIYLTLNNYHEARKYLSDGFALAKEIGLKEYIVESYKDLTVLDSATGNWKSAYENHKLYILNRDSLVNEENTKKIVQATMQKEFDEKETLSKATQEKKDVLQRNIRNSILVGAGFLLVLFILLISRYRIKQKANKQLDYANHSLQNLNNELVITMDNLKATQQQLVQSEKNAAFGVMAQRVAHEIQNPLNFVTNFSELSKELAYDFSNAKSDEEKKDTLNGLIVNLEKIHHHGKRAEGIVKQLQEHQRAGTVHDFFEDKV